MNERIPEPQTAVHPRSRHVRRTHLRVVRPNTMARWGRATADRRTQMRRFLTSVVLALGLGSTLVLTAMIQPRHPDGGFEYCDASVGFTSRGALMTERYYSHVYRVEEDRLTQEHNAWRQRAFRRRIPWQLGAKSRDGIWTVTDFAAECHYYESMAENAVRRSRDRHILDGNHARVKTIEVAWPQASVVAGNGQAISYGYYENRDAHQPSRLTMQFRDVSVAESVVDAILETVGAARNFAVQASYDISNAAAYYDADNNRVLGYNPDFMLTMRRRTGTDWAGVSIMAHEIGHHINDHLNPSQRTIYRSSSRRFELQADYFSGSVMHKLGASLEEAQAAMRELGGQGSRTHPPMRQRLDEIQNGWNASYRVVGSVARSDPRLEPQGSIPGDRNQNPGRGGTGPTRRPGPPRVPPPTTQIPMGSVCYTRFMACPLPGVGPVGTPCYCNTWYGPLSGQVGG